VKVVTILLWNPRYKAYLGKLCSSQWFIAWFHFNVGNKQTRLPLTIIV